MSDFHKTLAIDFDGVIHRYSKGWQDGRIYDGPVEGVREALNGLIQQGYWVLVYSTRCSDRVTKGRAEPHQRSEMAAWMKHHGIPYSEIYAGEGKPIAYLYIDDRALGFSGDWSATMEQVHRFKPWTEIPTLDGKRKAEEPAQTVTAPEGK